MMAAGSVQPRPGLTPYQPREGGPCFLSDMIIELGFVDEQNVAAAVETARSSGETVGRILVREGKLSEDQLARALAARYGLNHIDLDGFQLDADAANLLPPASAKRYKAVPVAFEPDGSLLVAMADPSDSLALSDIAFMTHLEVRATVAAADRIAELASRLPLPPSEFGSRFPVVAPAPEPEPAFAPPEPAPSVVHEVVEPPPPPPAPSFDSAELERLRGELDAVRSERDAARAERDATREELGAARAELDGMRAELDGLRRELEAARQAAERGAEAEQRAAEAERRAADFERRLAESGDAERRVAEAHAALERVRTEFEVEREGYAAGERELRARLASEEERHEALKEAHGSLQKRMDVLRNQNAALLDAYATAKRWSAEFARGARELAATLEQPVLDDAVAAQPQSSDEA